MSGVLIQIVVGLAVAAISGVSGVLFEKAIAQRTWVLPRVHGIEEKEGYTHLNGKWHLYWLSYDALDHETPRWFHGLQSLSVSHTRVTGTTELVDHPLGPLHFILRGEVRVGRMIVTDSSVEDETEFSSVVYSNVRSRTLLVGLWTGLDNALRPISAPAILSRAELELKDLNHIVTKSMLVVIPPAEYQLSARE